MTLKRSPAALVWIFVDYCHIAFLQSFTVRNLIFSDLAGVFNMKPAPHGLA
jgi:hypothetical protein